MNIEAVRQFAFDIIVTECGMDSDDHDDQMDASERAEAWMEHWNNLVQQNREPMPSADPDLFADAFAARLVQKLLRIQYLEDLHHAQTDPRGPAKQRSLTLALIQRYKSLGLSDVSLGEVRDIRQARTSDHD